MIEEGEDVGNVVVVCKAQMKIQIYVAPQVGLTSSEISENITGLFRNPRKISDGKFKKKSQERTKIPSLFKNSSRTFKSYF